MNLNAKLETGFITKIKKLLETVCHNCGKVLVDEVSHSLRDDRVLYMSIVVHC